ncbi:MAG: methyltransferase [Aquificae bacterium]|nr:methyltransferase [Aquificota bacterium]
MKKLIYTIPTQLFEIFVVELNGYGIEVINKDEKETVFALYSEDSEVEALKSAVENIFEDLGNGKLLLEENIKEENWEEKWKENFKPIKVPPFIIIPEWEIYEGSEYIPIKLKIAQAFGTGLHATTQLVLSLLPKYIKEGKTVLDIGTGTGILAIAAAKLGAEKVDAVDIHDKAVEECKINAWENQVKINCYQKSADEIKNSYDVVLANLQIEIFRNSFENISKLFKEFLIISGIFKEKEKEEILNMAKKENLSLLEEKSKPESLEKPEDLWYAFVFKHS